jgi:transposase
MNRPKGTKRPYRRHSREFKLEAAKMVLEQGMKQSEVARKLDINAQQLFRWLEEYRHPASAELAHPKVSQKAQAQRVKELEEKVRRLEMESAILKKAMAYFAKEPE